MSKKLDILKIIFVGVPIFLIWCAVVFISLAFISRDIMISKYGSLSIVIISIPIYGYFTFKYASELGVTIETEKDEIRNSNVQSQGFKRRLTKFDSWCAGIILMVMLIYFFIGQVIYGIKADRLLGYVKWIIIFAVPLELALRKLFGKNIK